MDKVQRNDRHWCGVSFIGDNKALTAAHCVDDGAVSEYQVKFEGHDLSNETQWQTYQVTRIISHEQYDYYFWNNNDIAVLELDRPVENITPIQLADHNVKNELNDGDTLKVIGWGRLGLGGGSPEKLQEVDLQYVPNDICNDIDHHNGSISDTMMCAGVPEGDKSPCHGDSGGPLMVDRNGKWVQVGVVSWGVGCGAPNRPGVFADVSSLLLWTHINAFDFGFGPISQQQQLYINDSSSETIFTPFKNTLQSPLFLSNVTLTESPDSLNNTPENVSIVRQDCANTTLDAKQQCGIAIQIQDHKQYGNYNIDVEVGNSDSSTQTISGNFNYYKTSEFDENINEHLASSESIQWITGGDAKWYTGTTDDNINALFSGDINDSEQTFVVAKLNNQRIREFSFDYLLSSESCCDHITVFHNGKQLTLDSYNDETFRNISITLTEEQNEIAIHYTKDLSVSSGTDNITIKNITTTFINSEPTAIVENTKIKVRSELDFILDASLSFDKNGDELAYQWIDLAKPEEVISTSALVSLTADKVDSDTIKTYQVTVIDEYDAISTAQVTVNTIANQAPIIELAQDTIHVRSEMELTLDASASVDPESDALTFSWVKLANQDVVVGDESVTIVKADKVTQDSTVIYQLTVTDSFGASSSAQVNAIIAKNNAPQVSIVSEAQNVSAGEKVLITSIASDLEGDELTYTWTQTAGKEVTLPENTDQLSFTAPEVTKDETLTFVLTVKDAFGLSHSQEVSITVKAPVVQESTAEPVKIEADKSSGSLGSFSLLMIALITVIRRVTAKKAL
nr:serine protease [Pseudoalteromonas luteoviolacea]